MAVLRRVDLDTHHWAYSKIRPEWRPAYEARLVRTLYGRGARAGLARIKDGFALGPKKGRFAARLWVRGLGLPPLDPG